MEEKYNITLSDYIGATDHNLFMDKKVDSTVDYSALQEEALKLQGQLLENIRTRETMIDKLHVFKLSKDIEYHEVNGGLEISGPANISDSDFSKIGQQVGVIDRIINTKVDEFKTLDDRYLVITGGREVNVFRQENNHLAKKYKGLFEK